MRTIPEDLPRDASPAPEGRALARARRDDRDGRARCRSSWTASSRERRRRRSSSCPARCGPGAVAGGQTAAALIAAGYGVFRDAVVFGFAARFSAASSFSSFATRASSASIPRTFFESSSTRAAQVVERLERPLAARQARRAAACVLTAVGETCDHVLLRRCLGASPRSHPNLHRRPLVAPRGESGAPQRCGRGCSRAKRRSRAHAACSVPWIATGPPCGQLRRTGENAEMPTMRGPNTPIGLLSDEALVDVVAAGRRGRRWASRSPRPSSAPAGRPGTASRAAPRGRPRCACGAVLSVDVLGADPARSGRSAMLGAGRGTSAVTHVRSVRIAEDAEGRAHVVGVAQP